MRKLKMKNGNYQKLLKVLDNLGGRATVGEVAEHLYGRNSKANRRRTLALLAVNNSRGRTGAKKVSVGVISLNTHFSPARK